ncbi:hypothetical protein E8E14_011109 [Neopestalotiopsis sp. 37M]|nr:hypothetical protein E8E14_011109 [Neopestalotiopsis sp. 37M]
MFLNTIQKDFDHDSATTNDAFRGETDCSISPKPRRVDQFVPLPTGDVKEPSHLSRFTAQYDYTLYGSSTYMQMSTIEGQLWSYFDQRMTPQCVLTPNCNPYRNVILRLAASSQRGSLFHCVLAVAANQLHSIGLHQYQQFMWLHRAEALRQLRGKVNSAATAASELNDSGDTTAIAQITASTLMLCFFEILQDCSQSWIVHTTFAQTYLSRSYNRSSMSADYEQFHRFCMTYIHSHNILAATAGTEVVDPDAVDRFCASADDATVLALAGCSTKLLATISEINCLSTAQVNGQPQSSFNDDRKRRDQIERRLYSQDRILSASSTAFPEPELSLIAEVKRLATLLYLYGRIDGASPQEHHMVRITQQILVLIPQISLRTNTILWPLFIAAVLGVRPECDEDRKLILARLAALQETRQLGNVKKARRVIEDVWKARDLRASDAAKGWDILKGRHQTISLA